jgi:hypothetical protein
MAAKLAECGRKYSTGKKKKLRSAVFRRHQERLMQRLVELVQKLTLAPGHAN